MSEDPISDDPTPGEPSADRLDSWKEIAAYLKRDVRTVHRWEADEGLPVHRHVHLKRATVYAYKSELEDWWKRSQALPEKNRKSAIAIWPTRPPPAGKVRLVVLPFENVGGDPQQEYFSEGMTEEMTTALANLHPERLAVIARTSAMKYRHGEKGIDQIARELAVDYVLESSVRRSNDRVWVTTALIQANDQTNLWAQTYEREVGDAPALQSEISRAIAKEIALQLNPKEEARLANPRQINPQAHEAYLKGLFFWAKFTPSGMEKSIEYFQSAIDQEPGYALAYARMARAYGLLGFLTKLSPERAYPREKEAALKALELDPTLDEAHCALGWSKLLYDRDWAGARQEFERAVTLSPNSPVAHQAYATYFVSMGQFEQAMTEILRAQELDPVSLNVKSDVGWFLFFARRPDESIAKIREALEMDPNFVIAHNYLASAYQQKGRFEESIAESQTSVKLSGSDPLRIALLAYAYALAGQNREAQQELDRLRALSHEKYISPYHMALVYAGLHNNDEAFNWLEKAFRERFWMMAFLKVDPRWDVLRTDRRFTDLLKRSGLAS